MIANLQYGWTLFINPIDAKYHWGRAAIQVAFTLFIVTETLLQPLGGYLVDRFGPRVLACGGGVMVALSWTINSVADSLVLLYSAAVIAGLGAGPIFGATVGNAMRWFPDRRGLAGGLSAAGFGAGSALTVVPIAHVIQTSGYEAAYLWFGLGQGLVIMPPRSRCARRNRRRLPASPLGCCSKAAETAPLLKRSNPRRSGSCTRCSSWSERAA
jgi:OFA family oxalate/formate antiporter-like MFS transporter